MNAVADSSVIIASMAEWHEHHSIAKATIHDINQVVPHTLAEVFSALTRMPNGMRIASSQIVEYFSLTFQDELMGMSYLQSIQELQLRGIVGGATFDGLIAINARNNGCRLLTLDHRAIKTYESVGTIYTLLN